MKAVVGLNSNVTAKIAPPSPVMPAEKQVPIHHAIKEKIARKALIFVVHTHAAAQVGIDKNDIAAGIKLGK